MVLSLKKTSPLLLEKTVMNMFQTFLPDKDNKVIIIGNPIHNRAIRSLYIKELTGKEEKKSINTMIDMPVTQVDPGTLKMGEEKRASFTINNVGHQPLAIYDVVASCGCTKVEYEQMKLKFLFV